MQDFLNVRNWQQCDSDLSASETAEDNDDSDYFIKTALNDGPEGLVFIPEDVPYRDQLVARHHSVKQHTIQCRKSAYAPKAVSTFTGVATRRMKELSKP